MSLVVNKVLVDYDGIQIGTGKVFAVRLYDSDMNLVQRIMLSANSPGVTISGLRSGTVYYLQEEVYDGFDTLTIELLVNGRSVGAVHSDSLGLMIPVYENSLFIEAVITNLAYDLILIPDVDIPLGPYDPPTGPPMINIPEEERPINPPTGDRGAFKPVVYCAVAAVGLSIMAAALTSKRRARRKTKA